MSLKYTRRKIRLTLFLQLSSSLGGMHSFKPFSGGMHSFRSKYSSLYRPRWVSSEQRWLWTLVQKYRRLLYVLLQSRIQTLARREIMSRWAMKLPCVPRSSVILYFSRIRPFNVFPVVPFFFFFLATIFFYLHPFNVHLLLPQHFQTSL